MKSNKTKGWIWLESIALMFAVVFGSALVSASAQIAPSNPKVSDDLENIVNNQPDVTHVYAVIVTPSKPTNSFLSYLNTISVVVSRNLVNMPMLTVKIPVKQIYNIAARTDVSYVSLDREARKTGHISLTTGADAASRLGGSTEYNGAGVGIAVLDSGIYSNHASFVRDGVSRITYSQDFTGSGTTADAYGHGTHVAAIAVGNDSIANGAYKGIATKANIINLKVLKGDGTGSLSGLLFAIDWILSNRTTHKIRVVNMSLGTEAVDSYKNDPLCQAARKLVGAGVVVVAAAGNQGKDSTGKSFTV